MAKKAKENKRTICEGLLDAEILALSKALSDSSAEAKKARARLKTDVYPVDMLVRITGDIEVGKAEEQPAKFETGKYLLLALSLLPAAKREQVLAADFEDMDETTAGQMAAMGVVVDKVKEARPMLPTAPKLTAHLTTTLMQRYEAVALAR